MTRIETEAERQFYMSAFGVRLWYARLLLPGAAPTPDSDFWESVQDEPAALVVPAVQKPASRLPMSGRPDISRIMEKPSAATQFYDQEREQPDTARTDLGHGGAREITSESGEPQRFETPGSIAVFNALTLDLGFWWSADTCLIGTVSDLASETLQNRLADNILAALDCTPSHHERLRWPVFNNSRVPEDSSACLVQILKALGDQCRDMKTIVWLGLSSQLSEAESLVRDLMGEPTVDFDQGLAVLAGDYQYKRALWQKLKQALKQPVMTGP